jgi:hypothetical protein
VSFDPAALNVEDGISGLALEENLFWFRALDARVLPLPTLPETLRLKSVVPVRFLELAEGAEGGSRAPHQSTRWAALTAGGHLTRRGQICGRFR